MAGAQMNYMTRWHPLTLRCTLPSYHQSMAGFLLRDIWFPWKQPHCQAVSNGAPNVFTMPAVLLPCLINHIGLPWIDKYVLSQRHMHFLKPDWVHHLFLCAPTYYNADDAPWPSPWEPFLYSIQVLPLPHTVSYSLFLCTSCTCEVQHLWY